MSARASASGCMSTAHTVVSSASARKARRSCAASNAPIPWSSTRTRRCSCRTERARSWRESGADLLRSFAAEANYLERVELEGVGPSPSDLGPELTRHFRALRLWLPLQLAGVAAFRAAQSEKIELARWLHARLAALPGFEVGRPPDLSVVAFRYRPGRGDADAFNQRLLAFVQDEGRVFLSGTRIDGAFHLRAAILSFRTHLVHVEAALASLERGVEALTER